MNLRQPQAERRGQAYPGHSLAAAVLAFDPPAFCRAAVDSEPSTGPALSLAHAPRSIALLQRQLARAGQPTA